MSEVATWSMIRSKISSFPAPSSGRGNECLTKSEIVSMGGENLRINGSYGNNECVMLDDILANVITWEYTFNVSPISLSFDAIGGTKSVSVTSYKRKYINGSYTGVQEGIGYSSSVSGTGFSSQGTSVSVNINYEFTGRNGTVVFTQDVSGKSVTVALSQSKAKINDTGEYTIILMKPPTETITASSAILTRNANRDTLTCEFYPPVTLEDVNKIASITNIWKIVITYDTNNPEKLVSLQLLNEYDNEYEVYEVTYIGGDALNNGFNRYVVFFRQDEETQYLFSLMGVKKPG